MHNGEAGNRAIYRFSDIGKHFEYFTESQRHFAAVAARPGECMPWHRPCWRGCTIMLHL
jgi:hypothetical protein